MSPNDSVDSEVKLLENLEQEEIKNIECDRMGSDKIFEGTTGTVFTVDCP